jgi:transposase
VLVELRLVEQRHQAVLEVFAGVSVTQVAFRYGVTRQTVHRWALTRGGAGANTPHHWSHSRQSATGRHPSD